VRAVAAGSSLNLAERRCRSLSVLVAGLYLAAGVVWILFTDVILYRLVDDPVLIARFETAKGWTFVGLTAALLYVIVKWTIRGLAYSEAITRAIIDSIADGVLIIGPERAIVGANPAAARMLGAESAEALIGLGPEEFARRFRVTTDAGTVVAPDRYVSQRALSGEVPPAYKAHLFPPGRDELVIVSSAAPVRASPGGPVESAVSVMHDVTALDGLDRLREQFFAAAAHAFKTPVAIIKAHVFMAARRSAAPDHSLEVLDRQCDRLARIVENLILSGHLRSGTLRLDSELVDWGSAVDTVTAEMAHASADHRLTGVPVARPVVWADRDRLIQAMRCAIELAYRRARAGADVRIGLTTHDGRARFQVAYEELPLEHALEHRDGAGYTGLELEGYVMESLVHAMGGTTCSQRTDAGDRTDVIELPVRKRDAHA
jgi:signal transduction histidine kinase